MNQLPFEQTGSLRIGTVDFVSPSELKVVLDIESPESIALNTGSPRSFPRVNGYLLTPVDDRLVVGQIEWITVEPSPFPRRRGMQDFGLVDLPYPLRKLRLNPLGTLRTQSVDGQHVFKRGSDVLPSVGAPVLLPTNAQLRSIVESGEQRRVRIGVSPLAEGAEVRIDPDRLFGRHLAVLGNTGSGKSCSVAGLIRWSILQSQVDSHKDGHDHPNARFILLDPNGEYSRAFDTDGPVKARIFKVDAPDGIAPLRVPLWFWNSAEWTSFTQASVRTQRPTLVQALRFARDGSTEPAANSNHELRRFLRTLVSTIRIEQNNGSPWGSFPKPKAFYEKLQKWKDSLEKEMDAYGGEERRALQKFVNKMEELCKPRRAEYPHYDFTRQEVQTLLRKASKAHSAFGGAASEIVPPDPDVPRPFDGTSFARNVEATAELLNVSDHVETLLIRIRALLNDTRMIPILDDSDGMTLGGWLEAYIGGDDAKDGCISVIDLSLVPSEIVHVVTAVIARMTLEALQRYVKLTGVSLPTILVMEEAHNFVRRYREDLENQDAATVCCQVFERIAREGRKFGLGLVLSSQRPSELSPTVLSQCNSFLLHRISNDRDQELVNRLAPDNLRGLLRDLPGLPSQNAILLGWASELPVVVKLDDLPRDHQPRSEDPEIWKVWTRRTERRVNWDAIADDWQRPLSPDEAETSAQEG